ncbi:hypothetical protein D3C84_801790 [compost metagenome]
MVETVVAAARPGGLDQLVMGCNGDGHGRFLCQRCRFCVNQCCSVLFIVNVRAVQVFSGYCSFLFRCESSVAMAKEKVALRQRFIEGRQRWHESGSAAKACPITTIRAAPCRLRWSTSAAPSTTSAGLSMPASVSSRARSMSCSVAPCPARPA